MLKKAWVLLREGVRACARAARRRQFLWRAGDRPPALIPEVSLSDIVKPGIEIIVVEPEYVAGNVSLYELVVINTLVRSAKPKTGFEIGTFDGRTTLNIAANGGEEFLINTLDLPSTSRNGTTYRLDEEDLQFIKKPASGGRFLKHPYSGRIRQLYGDSASFDFRPFSKTIDLMFIDGSHSYENVLSDSRNALEIVRPGGIILWHDYDTEWWFGVTRALNELYEKDHVLQGIRHIVGTSICILTLH